MLLFLHQGVPGSTTFSRQERAGALSGTSRRLVERSSHPPEPCPPCPSGCLRYAPNVPTSEPAVARTQITDPTGLTYELQLMDGASLRDPDRPPPTTLLSRLGARVGRQFASSVARPPKDVQTFTIRVVSLRDDHRELECTIFTDLMNRDSQIARITEAITTGNFDPERLDE